MRKVSKCFELDKPDQNFELWYLEPSFNIKMIVKNQACLDNVIVLEIIKS